MVKFKFFSGDVDPMAYGGAWISPKLNNGDWDYWLILAIMNLEDACGSDAPNKYNVELRAVSPQAAAGELQSAARCCGLELEELDTWEKRVDVLNQYGVYAPIWSANGNNYRNLMREARRFANQEANCLFGFVMDRPVNTIGSNGWDFISGNISRPLGIGVDITDGDDECDWDEERILVGVMLANVHSAILPLEVKRGEGVQLLPVENPHGKPVYYRARKRGWQNVMTIAADDVLIV